MVNICSVCGSEGAKRCGKCRSVCYCSVECQKKDWKDHKKACKVKQNSIAAPNSDSEDAKAIFSEPFTLEKFVPYVNRIKEVTKQCAEMWVRLRLNGKMPVDTSLPTCFVYYASKGYVREHMVMFEGPPPSKVLQEVIDRYWAHAVSVSVEMRYRNSETLAVLQEGVLLHVCARGYDKKFFFDQTRGGRSDTGVLLAVSDAEESCISLFDSALLTFH